VPGREAVFVLTSYAEEEVRAEVKIDPQPLGFTDGYRVVEVESGEEVPVRNHRFSLRLRKHGVGEFRLLPR